jgi:hypothetical protein
MQKQIEWWKFESKKLLPSSKQQFSLSLWRGINKLQLKVWTSLNCDVASIATRLLNFTFPGNEMASVRRWDYYHNSF